MSENHKPTAKAEATPDKKGVRKVNISELAGQLSSKGKPPYKDDELLSMYRESLVDGLSLIWEAVVIEGDTESEVTASKAKWRNRASSVFGQLNVTTHTLKVQWTQDNECVLTLVKKS